MRPQAISMSPEAWARRGRHSRCYWPKPRIRPPTDPRSPHQSSLSRCKTSVTTHPPFSSGPTMAQCPMWARKNRSLPNLAFVLKRCPLFFFGVQLLYNVVLVSAVQQSESAICLHMSAPTWISHPHPSRSSQSTKLSSLCYTAASH